MHIIHFVGVKSSRPVVTLTESPKVSINPDPLLSYSLLSSVSLSLCSTSTPSLSGQCILMALPEGSVAFTEGL